MTQVRYSDLHPLGARLITSGSPRGVTGPRITTGRKEPRKDKETERQENSGTEFKD